MTQIRYQLSAFMIFLSICFSQCTIVQHCPDKDSFLNSYDELIDEINKGREEFTTDEWKQKDSKVKELLDVCFVKYEEELNFKERIRVMKNTFIYSAHRDLEDLELVAYDLNDQMENIGEEGKIEIERFIKEELGPNLESAIDNVLDGINELGEELKSWLKE